MFSHDTELSIITLVDLVNSDRASGGTEGLSTADNLRDFVTRHHVSSVKSSDYQDLDAVYRVRRTFRAVFESSQPAQVAAVVNTLLAQAPVSPRLTEHDGYEWHAHYFSPGASLADHLAVDGGMALAQVVTAGETDRLRLCEAPDCSAALIDLSRNRSKRYCDARSCGNRLNVAAYRERKRHLAAPATARDRALAETR